MAKQHVRPTKEELEANLQKITQELEKPEAPVAEPEPSTPAPEPEPEPEPEPVEVAPSEAAPEPEPEPSQPAPEVDYKKKFTESTREAQILSYKNRKIAEAIDTASELPQPTEDELTREYPEWDTMTDLERRLATDNLYNKRRFELLEGVRKEEKDIQAWNKKVDDYAEDPKTLIDNPELEGKVEEFKAFATKPSRRGVEFETLVSSFLYNVEKQAKKKPANKGSMIETGSGGPNDRPKPKSDKISTEEAMVLMKTNYAKYKEYLTAEKILPPIV